MNDKVNEDLLLAIIKKGGSVPTREPKGHEKEMSASQFEAYYKEIAKVQMRLPRWLIRRIDDLKNEQMPLYTSRHNWIMDAILTKLVSK